MLADVGILSRARESAVCLQTINARDESNICEIDSKPGTKHFKGGKCYNAETHAKVTVARQLVFPSMPPMTRAHRMGNNKIRNFRF